jgi:hypothetical protein
MASRPMLSPKLAIEIHEVAGYEIEFRVGGLGR